MPPDQASDAAQRLRQQMSAIAARLLERTTQDLRTMEELVRRIQAGDATGFPALRQLAHRLNGSAAALGFPALSAHGASVERLAGAAASGAVLHDTITAIEQEIAALRTALTHPA